MKNTPSFTKSVFESFRSRLSIDMWDTVMETYEKGSYKEALYLLLDYIDKDIRKNHTGSDDFFEIPHGSILVRIWINDEQLKVEAPFLKVTDKTKRVPLYRHIAELNFEAVGLPSIILKEGELSFAYTCPLNLCEPYKIYSVLQDICIQADRYDEEFITKFEAEHFVEPKVTHYEQAVLDDAYQTIQSIVTEGLEYIDFFQSKRYTNYIWDAVDITLKRIDFFISPQGHLKNEIEKSIDMLNSSQLPIEEKLQKGEQFLRELKAKEKDEVIKDLYRVNQFITSKFSADLDTLQQKWQQPCDNAKKEISQGYHMGACLTMITNIYSAFYYAELPDEITKKMTFLLESTSGQPWEKAAKELMEGMNKILENKPLEASGGGFLKRLFS